MENSEMVKKANEFREWFANEFHGKVKNVNHMDDNYSSFSVELADGVSQADFIDENTAIIQDRIDFDFPLSIWIYGNGDKLEDAIDMSFNYEYDEFERDMPYTESDMFQVTANGLVMDVRPLETGEYEIHANGKYLATIFAEIKLDMSVEWRSIDLISNEMAQEIGEAIEEFER